MPIALKSDADKSSITASVSGLILDLIPSIEFSISTEYPFRLKRADIFVEKNKLLTANIIFLSDGKSDPELAALGLGSEFNSLEYHHIIHCQFY